MDSHQPAGFLAYPSDALALPRADISPNSGVHIVIGYAGRVIFGLDVVLDKMQAGAFLGSEAGGLDNLGYQELRLQEMLQLGNILRRQLIVAGRGRADEAKEEDNGAEGITHWNSRKSAL